MLDLVTVEIGKFVRNINKKRKGTNYSKKVVYQAFWLIGCSQ